MIKVKLYRNRENLIDGYIIRGHAEDSNICAGVSTLAQSFLSLLKTLEGDDVQWARYRGHMVVDIRKPENVEDVTEVFVSHLYSIEKWDDGRGNIEIKVFTEAV